MNNEVLVSVICIAYNHEKYITECLESILMQKTDFNFEIIIHDDASTDKTTGIIKKYEEQYPNLIKTIYQVENQYSKGKKVIDFAIKIASGKYIAYCECDDYWDDPFKLQKQIDYMQNHPECSLCVHSAYLVNNKREKFNNYLQPNVGNKLYTAQEVIKGGGGLFATNSMIYPRKLSLTKPDFYYNCSVGDYPTAIYLALNGTVYYMDEFMASYRMGVEGSWTSTNFKDIEKKEKHFIDMAKMLDEVNEYTNHKYDDVIQWTKYKNEFEVLMLKGDIKKARSGVYKQFFNEFSFKLRIILLIKYYFPGLVRLKKRIF